MPEAASGNVGSRNGAADGKDDVTAGAAVEADAGPAEEPAAEPSVEVDETEALMRNFLAGMQTVNRKRQLDEMQRLGDLHVLDMQERLNAQKTKHDEVFLQAQTTIKHQNMEISTYVSTISQKNTDIETHLATIAIHVKTQQLCRDEQKRLEEENTALRDKMQSSQDLCAQLHAIMNPGHAQNPEHSQQHAQQGSLHTSCRQEVQASVQA